MYSNEIFNGLKDSLESVVLKFAGGFLEVK